MLHQLGLGVFDDGRCPAAGGGHVVLVRVGKLDTGIVGRLKIDVGVGRGRGKAGRVARAAQAVDDAAVVAALQQAAKNLLPVAVAHPVDGQANVLPRLGHAHVLELAPRPAHRRRVGQQGQHVAARLGVLRFGAAVIGEAVGVTAAADGVQVERRVTLETQERRPKRVTRHFAIQAADSHFQFGHHAVIRHAVTQGIRPQHGRILRRRDERGGKVTITDDRHVSFLR